MPGLVTQDGPAHLYNACILLDSIRGDSALADTFRVRWQPLPNWAGHLALTALMAAGASPWVADRVVMSLTLAGLAAAILWLRQQVRGTEGLPTAALLATLFSMNLTWLLGFSSFLIGACLFPLSLGLWWTGRERPGPARAFGLAALLVASYFAHVVALGLTALALVILELATPAEGSTRRRRRLWTAVAMLPLVPLGMFYLSIMAGGGPIAPSWVEFDNPASPASWWTRLVWVDPLTLGRKTALPFRDVTHPGFFLLTPVLWAALGVIALTAATTWNRDAFRKRRGWVVLAGLLLTLGILGPDTLGERHGHYLTQRLFLVGLISLVPLLDLAAGRRLARFGAGAVALAVVLQSAFLWDYAWRSDRAIAEVRALAARIEPGSRVGTLWLNMRTPFRANPIRHAGGVIGTESRAVVWSNYEAAHYYFPVQVRPGLDHPPVLAFEEVSILDAPEVAGEQARVWEHLLQEHHPSIDLLVVQGRSPEGLDPITDRWYEPVAEAGQTRLLRRREGQADVARAAGTDHPAGR